MRLNKDDKFGNIFLPLFVVDSITAVQMKMSVSAEEPTLHWKRKANMTYPTHILTNFLKLKVATYIKNTALLDFAKRKTYFYDFQ